MDIDKHIIGKSKDILEIKRFLKRLSGSNVHIIIIGERGTGKDLIAQTVHDMSPNRYEPYIKVDFAVASDELRETELFGSPDAGSVGKLVLAGNGTLSIDNIDEWPQELQKRLITVMQNGGFTSGRFIPLKCRIVAMSHRDLRLAVEGGVFREDLFYRLNVIPLHIPPLRERFEDIQPLFEYFISRFGPTSEKLVAKVGYNRILTDLQDYSWPGNVRELKDIISLFFLTGDWETVRENLLTATMNEGRSVIVKAIEFPPEYFQAGISILSYFGTILHDKYPEKSAKIRIEQDNFKVTLIVSTGEGDLEVIEATFADFGKVISGRMSPEQFLSDPLHVLALKNKLELAQQELRLTRDLLNYVKQDKEERIKNLENYVNKFYSLVGAVLQQSTSTVHAIKDVSLENVRGISINLSAFLKSMAAQNENIRNELSILSDKLSIVSPSENDVKDFKHSLSMINEKQPVTFRDIKTFWEQFGMGFASSVWATVITDTIRFLCK